MSLASAIATVFGRTDGTYGQGCSMIGVSAHGGTVRRYFPKVKDDFKFAVGCVCGRSTVYVDMDPKSSTVVGCENCGRNVECNTHAEAVGIWNAWMATERAKLKKTPTQLIKERRKAKRLKKAA